VSRAVLFDVDGVLIHGYHFRPEKRVPWDANLAVDLGVDPDLFRTRFIFDVFVKQVIVGRMDVLEALGTVLPGLGYSGTPESFLDYWLSHDSVLNRDLLAIVRRLQQSGVCRLYVATNQEHRRADWLMTRLGLGDLFEDIFHSAKVGATKPHKPYFDWVSNRLGPQATPPLFFDDTPEVVRAARAHGWEAVEYNELSDVAGHPWIASIVTSR